MKIVRANTGVTQRGDAAYFTGTVWIDPVAGTGMGRTRMARVSFEPGARTAWHTHPLGQVLHILSGLGRVQRAGGPITEVSPGDSVWFEPGERHWHGAAPGRSMVHLAAQLEDESGQVVTWLEKVTEAEYSGAREPIAPESSPHAPPAQPPPGADQGPPVLTDEERAAGFEIREIEHLADIDDWERTLRLRLPALGGPTKDFFRVCVLKPLNDSDAVFRVWHNGQRAYAHLRWGGGSAWGYPTFGGASAWHPVSDPIDSARAAATASTKAENPGISIQPEKFPSRAWKQP